MVGIRTRTLGRLVHHQARRVICQRPVYMNRHIHMPAQMNAPDSILKQRVLLENEEALQTSILWWDAALEASRSARNQGQVLRAVMLVLRNESAACG